MYRRAVTGLKPRRPWVPGCPAKGVDSAPPGRTRRWTLASSLSGHSCKCKMTHAPARRTSPHQRVLEGARRLSGGFHSDLVYVTPRQGAERGCSLAQGAPSHYTLGPQPVPRASRRELRGLQWPWPAPREGGRCAPAWPVCLWTVPTAAPPGSKAELLCCLFTKALFLPQ